MNSDSSIYTLYFTYAKKLISKIKVELQKVCDVYVHVHVYLCLCINLVKHCTGMQGLIQLLIQNETLKN